MKHAKYLVILAGLVGLYALSRPLVTGELAGGLVRIELSSFQGFTIVLSDEAVSELKRQGIEGDPEEIWRETIRRQSGYAQVEQAETVLMTLAMVPGFLLVLGVFGLKRFGRAHGFPSFLLGCAQILVWFALRQMVQVAQEQPIYEKIESTGTITFLLVSGCLAVAGGLMAIFKPEPKKIETS